MQVTEIMLQWPRVAMVFGREKIRHATCEKDVAPQKPTHEAFVQRSVRMSLFFFQF